MAAARSWWRRLRRYTYREVPGPGGACTLATLHFRVTPTGGLFAFNLLAVLLPSIWFQLNGGYLLAFTTAVLVVGSFFSLYCNLRGLHIRGLPPRPVWAGDPLSFDVLLTRPARRARARHCLELEGGLHPCLFDWPREQGAEVQQSLELPTTRRGLVLLPMLRLRSLWPLGLMQAEAHWLPALTGLAYPRPEAQPPALPLPTHNAHDPAECTTDAAGDAHWSALRPYQAGDRLQRVAWSVYAKSDGQVLATREFSGTSGELILTPDLAAGAGDWEAIIARLTAWVLLAEQSGVSYGLAIGETVIAASLGRGHCDQCLAHLALLPTVAPA